MVGELAFSFLKMLANRAKRSYRTVGYHGTRYILLLVTAYLGNTKPCFAISGERQVAVGALVDNAAASRHMKYK